MIISLTGGLGNQLFQMFAGLAFTDDEIGVTTQFGNPRSTNGKVDLFHFLLPSRVKIFQGRRGNRLSYKAGNLALRQGLVPSERGKSSNLLSSSNLILKVYLSWHLQQKVNLFSSESVGLSPVVPKPTDLVFGYFQTYRYFWGLAPEDQNIELASKSDNFLNLRERAKNAKPVVVHVRQGDYKSENHFGTIGSNYYLRALSKIYLHGPEHDIWLFSDEPKIAKSLIPVQFADRIFVVPTTGVSPAETLELMRYGSAYVIANSTFSWWGATLSHAVNPLVLAPSFWFAGMPEPRDLVPENWQRIER